MDFFELAKPQLREIKPYEPGKYFDGRGDVLKLASNENLLGISEKVREAIIEELDYLHYYPDNTSGKARSALAKEYGVEPSNLIMGNGSGEIMSFLTSAFLGAGDEMIMPWPGFAACGIYARAEGAKVVRVPLDSNFRADLSAMLNAVNESTRLICLDNPNNPSGTHVGEAELLRFLEAVPESVLVILDEAYWCFTDAGDYPDSTHLWNKYPNLLVCRTFSKIYALAGLRAGAAVGSESLLDVLWQVKAPYNLNRLAESALVAALEDTEFFEKTVRHVKKMRSYIGGLLDEAGLYHPESQTNYFLIDTGVDCVELGKLMIEDGIYIRPMIRFGLETFIRASFPVERADADRFIATLIKNIARLGKAEAVGGE